MSEDGASTTRLARRAAIGRVLQVLVVEDNHINRELMRLMLGDLGQQTCFAGDGHEALRAVGLGGIDLVLMDVQMPLMDGLEATRRIRRREREHGLPRLPILGVSAHAREEDRRAGAAAGMDGYLVKPVTLDQLARAMSALVGQALPGNPARAAAAGPAQDAVIDPEVLQRIRGYGSALVKDLYGSFATSLGERRQGIGQAALGGKLAEVARLAHGLKGSAATLGMHGLADSARQVEEAGRSGEAAAVAAARDRLDASMQAAEAAISALLASV